MIHDVISHDSNEMHASGKKYDIVYVVAGSNDCTKQQNTSETIAQSARAVADAALQLSQRVVLSSILPRTDDHTAQLKAENTNINLKRMCDQDTKLTFCDNDRNFRLADKSIDELVLWKDKHHLRYVGSERLIKNLNINATICKRQRVKNTFQQNQWYNGQWPSNANDNRRNWNQFNFHSNTDSRSRDTWNNGYTSTCDTCHRYGHSTYSCPVTANMHCFKCGSRGHLQKHCSS